MKKSEICMMGGGTIAIFCIFSAVILVFFGACILGDTLPFHLVFHGEDANRKAKGIGVMIAAAVYAVVGGLGVAMTFSGRALKKREDHELLQQQFSN